MKNNDLKKLHEEFNKQNGIFSNNYINSNANKPNPPINNNFLSNNKSKSKDENDLVLNEKGNDVKYNRSKHMMTSIDMDEEGKQFLEKQSFLKNNKFNNY